MITKNKRQFAVISLSICMFTLISIQELTGQNSEENPVSFSKQIIHAAFISEGIAVGDMNNDGIKDILAGAYWFEAPQWIPHEIKMPKELDYAKEYSDTFLNFTMDVNYDGWMDVIRIGLPGEGVYWYENPKGKDDHWQPFLIDSNVCNESPMLVDVDDNGKMDLVFGHEDTNTMMWFRSPQNAQNLEWEAISISNEKAFGTEKYSHGLGFNDVNGDKRKDIITRHGWWEAPINREKVPWIFHKATLGKKCSQMFAYDFDNDGDNDIVSSSAHSYGIWWHENIAMEFTQIQIDSSFSQAHGAAFTDINNDNLPDFVTGKRFFAHLGKDPGSMEPAVLYWFELQRDSNNQPQWKPHLVDDQSGVGLQVVVEDMNNDGKPDIITSNKKGVFCFIQD